MLVKYIACIVLIRLPYTDKPGEVNQLSSNATQKQEHIEVYMYILCIIYIYIYVYLHYC